MSEHVAAPLYRHLGPGSFDFVAGWLRGVAGEHALDVDGKVVAPSVAWLAEAVTSYDYDAS